MHPDFEHFFSMFWFCCKIEHIVRHMTKCWLEDNSDDKQLALGGDSAEGEEGVLDMQSMCEKFSSEQEEYIKDMHAVATHAFSHVIHSIYTYPPMQKKNDEACSLALKQKKQDNDKRPCSSPQQRRRGAPSASRKQKDSCDQDAKAQKGINGERNAHVLSCDEDEGRQVQNERPVAKKSKQMFQAGEDCNANCMHSRTAKDSPVLLM